MIRVLYATALAGSLALFLTACTELRPIPVPGDGAKNCRHFFEEMDRLVARHGVQDAGAARITGFPELRVDRFLASFADEDPAGEAYSAWVERMRRLDATARRIELRNLPPGASIRLQNHTPPGLPPQAAIDACGKALTGQRMQAPEERVRLLRRAKVPDSYSRWQRFLGLYVLTRWAIVEGISRVHRELREPFIRPPPSPPHGARTIRYAPRIKVDPDAASIAGILDKSAANPLRIPEPSGEDLDRLFTAFAPVFAVETMDGTDRIGAVRIDPRGESYVDVTRPVVYRFISHARMAGRPLLQLNYLIWFPARPPKSWLDIYAGRFDGLIWRVTLGTDGSPIAYDSIHPCGCYYLVFPGRGYQVVQPRDGSEPVLSPTPILPLRRGERLVLWVASRTHFIQGVTSERSMPRPMVYDWLDYDELRSLPGPDGRHRSLFDAQGLVPRSERSERFLFWPMGVPSAGAMRQWGTHAIAFLGTRHFDDPRLLEKLLRPLGE
ncbi:MAG TPA: hypothetical protein VNL74_03475 [Methylococcus sp.]|nr:hypothetical protein [Methylococcus sp.]